MARTNVVIDDELLQRVKDLYGLKTTKEAIHFALLSLVSPHDRTAILELRGMGWEGDLELMRESKAEWS